MAPAAKAKEGGLALEIATSGLSVATATLFTNPLDVIKTRLQLQQRPQLATAAAAGGAAAAPRPLGLVATARAIVQLEGVGALWNGVTPSAARGMTYGGLRLGLYAPVKAALQSSGGGADGALSFTGKASRLHRPHTASPLPVALHARTHARRQNSDCRR